MAGTSGAAEIEWQLDAQDLRVVAGWIENAAARDGAPLTITFGRTINHVDTYLDTEDRRLDRAGYSVRLRRASRRSPEATLKPLDGDRADALWVRRELNERVDVGDPTAVARAPGPVGERVRALIGPRQLRPLFELKTRRRVFPLTAAGIASGELLLDETAIRAPDGRLLSRLRRVEVEVPEAAVVVVEPLVAGLQRACGLQPAVLSKYEAALVASGSERAEPVSFGPIEIAPADPIGRVALATLRRQFTILVAKEPGTRLGDDIEELHDMRVASRRLRAAVALFGDSLPAEAERLRPELAWIGRTIGAVRDLDVQLEQLDEWATVVPDPDREPLSRLRGVLVEKREQARAEMLQALDSRRYERFVRRFGLMLRSRSGARTPPALAAAPDLVERRYRTLRKGRRRIGREAPPDAYHRLRIAGKRFRYALEFLSDVYPGETKPLVKRTVALQDVLGKYQDAEVAIERLRNEARERAVDLGPETVFAMGELAERYRAGMDEVRAQVAPTYAPLAGKSWRRFRKHVAAARPAVKPAEPTRSA